MPPIEALAAGQGKGARQGGATRGPGQTPKSPFSQTHAISSLPYDLNAYFHREGTILGVDVLGVDADFACVCTNCMYLTRAWLRRQHETLLITHIQMTTLVP